MGCGASVPAAAPAKSNNFNIDHQHTNSSKSHQPRNHHPKKVNPNEIDKKTIDAMAALKLAKNSNEKCAQYMNILEHLCTITPDITDSDVRAGYYVLGLADFCIDDIAKYNIKIPGTIHCAQYATNILIQLAFNTDVCADLNEKTQLITAGCKILKNSLGPDRDPNDALFEDVAVAVSCILRLLWALVADIFETPSMDSVPTQPNQWVNEGALEYAVTYADTCLDDIPSNAIMLEVLVWCLGVIRTFCRYSSVRDNEMSLYRVLSLAVEYLRKLDEGYGLYGGNGGNNDHDILIVEHCLAILNHSQQLKAATSRLCRVKGLWELVVGSVRRFSHDKEVVFQGIQVLGKAGINFSSLHAGMRDAGALQLVDDLLDEELVTSESRDLQTCVFSLKAMLSVGNEEEY